MQDLTLAEPCCTIARDEWAPALRTSKYGRNDGLRIIHYIMKAYSYSFPLKIIEIKNKLEIMLSFP